MVNASMALVTNCDDNLAAPWVERIKELNFRCRTPGIMTLVRASDPEHQAV
jgi:hypothetical protein